MHDDRDTRTLLDLIPAITADVKEAAAAEVGLWKAILAWRVSGLKLGMPLLLLAVFLLQAALTALLGGLILTLAPAVGAGVATLIVVAVALLLVGVAAWIGIKRLGTLTAPLPLEGIER